MIIIKEHSEKIIRQRTNNIKVMERGRKLNKRRKKQWKYK